MLMSDLKQASETKMTLIKHTDHLLVGFCCFHVSRSGIAFVAGIKIQRLSTSGVQIANIAGGKDEPLIELCASSAILLLLCATILRSCDSSLLYVQGRQCFPPAWLFFSSVRYSILWPVGFRRCKNALPGEQHMSTRFAAGDQSILYTQDPNYTHAPDQ